MPLGAVLPVGAGDVLFAELQNPLCRAAIESGEMHVMLLAYIDESGDTGAVSAGGSSTYSLGCVLVDSDKWPQAFDELLAFRRRLRDSLLVPMRAEVKANYLIRNGGELRRVGLGREARRLIFRAHLRVLGDLESRAFAVVIDKRQSVRRPAEHFDMAWETLLQRLSRTSRVENSTFCIMHDEGEDAAIRKWVRKSRRFLTAGSAFGTGSLRVDASLLVDDPVPRKSHHSYFIQLADLVAYSAFRSIVPPSPSVASVCPQEMWFEVGSATHTAVAGLRPRAAPGIVYRQ